MPEKRLRDTVERVRAALTELQNQGFLGQNFTPLVSPFLGPGAADSVRF
jgi:hypothetical protein